MDLTKVKLKSPEEIIEKFRELIHRHRRKYLKRNLRPCPENCKMASMIGHKVMGCDGCQTPLLNQCASTKKFEPLYTKEELNEQFRMELRDSQILLREYRDIFVFMWLTGAFDTEAVDETVLSGVEQHRANGA